MKSANVLFDTSVYITYAAQAVSSTPGWLSAVVLQELTSGANGKADLQRFASLLDFYQSQERLLVPDREAWWQAGKILNYILSDAARARAGRSRPALGHERKQSIIRDVLIAVSAKQRGVTVISDNKDFPLIARYYRFRWKQAAAFFS